MIDRLAQYDVKWDSPSHDSSGSMPLGNGDVAANVWAEASGDVLILIAKSDAWDENGSLLKIGRVRIKIGDSEVGVRGSVGDRIPSLPNPEPQQPNPHSQLSLASGATFEQTLHLATAEIFIRMGATRVRIWADANAPVIRVDIDADQEITVAATVECWRTEPRTVKTQTGDLFRNLTGPDPYPTVVTPDVFLADADAITWCHHNAPREHDAYAINMRLQGLGDLLDQQPHPLLGRTFGASLGGDGFAKEGEFSIRSTSRREHCLAITVLTEHPSTPESWHESIRSLRRAHIAVDRASHDRWWRDFWERSHVFIQRPSKVPRFAEPPQTVTRAYLLQRFMNACAGRGRQPIKFNGSLFSYGTNADPDFRRWGGPGFWFQNQRLIYWPMLADGDLESFRVFADMYRDQLPLQRHRTCTYFNHPGAHYPETVTFWGAEISAHYGWTPFEQRTSPEAESKYVRYHFNGGIELSVMLHAWYELTNDESVLRDYLLPIAADVVDFYDHHYPRDENGRLRIEPSQALETWQDATNPLPDVAGLRYLLPRLIGLPGVDEAKRTQWSSLLDSLPPIPTTEQRGISLMAPGERYAQPKNSENPELYCIFPYRLYGLTKPDLALARQTFAARRNVNHMCWYQDDVQAAYLGLTHTAQANVVRRASAESHSDSRFPAFWNAFNDWIPDMDHGGVLQLAVQAMLMQAEGDHILLFPAWPAEWDVDFKLHAPGQTVVEASLREGKIASLNVTPASRSKDVINMLQPME